MSGPPPPPIGLTGPPRPSSFVPPQLRARGGPPIPPPVSNGQLASAPGENIHRPSMPRPQLRPPPGMMPGVSGGMMPVGLRPNQHTSVSGGPVRYAPPTVAAPPKVVYSSKPVINKPKTTASVETSKAEPVAGSKREAAEAIISQSNVTSGEAAVQSASASSLTDGQPHVRKDKKNKPVKEKRFIRTAANDVWEDQSLADWDPSKLH